MVSDENQFLLLLRIGIRRQFTSVNLIPSFIFLSLSFNNLQCILPLVSLNLSYLKFVEILGHVDLCLIKFEKF